MSSLFRRLRELLCFLAKIIKRHQRYRAATLILSSLDDHTLNDIGVVRDEIRAWATRYADEEISELPIWRKYSADDN